MPTAISPHAGILCNITRDGNAVFPAGFRQAPTESGGNASERNSGQ